MKPTGSVLSMSSTSKNVDWSALSATALGVRRDIIKMLGVAKSGHPGGSLSAADILVILYKEVLRHKPKEPKWPDRDRVIFSKGHGCPALYAVLADCGYFDKNSLLDLRKLGSPLQGHPDMRRLPGIEASTGSLGQGLSIASGCALAARFDKKDFRSYVIMSDGELNEGQTWEAASFISFRKLSSVVVVLDYNKYQLSGATKDILDMEPIADKWQAFGWETKEIDGHTHKEIYEALQWARSAGTAPRIIIAHTIKGKGVSFMENNNDFHGVAPTKDETRKALEELGESEAEIKRVTGMIN